MAQRRHDLVFRRTFICEQLGNTSSDYMLRPVCLALSIGDPRLFDPLPDTVIQRARRRERIAPLGHEEGISHSVVDIQFHARHLRDQNSNFPGDRFRLLPLDSQFAVHLRQIVRAEDWHITNAPQRFSNLRRLTASRRAIVRIETCPSRTNRNTNFAITLALDAHAPAEVSRRERIFKEPCVFKLHFGSPKRLGPLLRARTTVSVMAGANPTRKAPSAPK
ncbi:hypothetical protein BD830_1033 [Maritimibacter alkaliphilus HTCC2654]|nr:hypothetical protein BD830_1033 [Maritimibacter alkaliphilus HTCC2654]